MASPVAEDVILSESARDAARIIDEVSRDEKPTKPPYEDRVKGVKPRHGSVQGSTCLLFRKIASDSTVHVFPNLSPVSG